MDRLVSQPVELKRKHQLELERLAIFEQSLEQLLSGVDELKAAFPNNASENNRH